jgi:hypothetical protein
MSFIFKSLQILITLIIPKLLLMRSVKSVKEKSLVTYVEAIRSLRAAVILAVFIGVGFCLLALSCGMVIHGLYLLSDVDPRTFAIIEISLGASFITLFAGLIFWFSREKLWVESFKIDELAEQQSRAKERS